MIGAQFPVNLVLAGRKVLVVGGGRIAARKVGQLLAANAEIVVVAPEIAEEISDLPVTIIKRKFSVEDLSDAWLVITATGDTVVDQLIFDEAEKRRIWVNSADDPDRCSFTLPAVLRRGRLMVTTSTAGASPALASFLRARLGECLPVRWSEAVDELSTMRDDCHRDGVSTEDVDWHPIIHQVLARHGLNSFHPVTTGAAR